MKIKASSDKPFFQHRNSAADANILAQQNKNLKNGTDDILARRDKPKDRDLSENPR